MRRSDWGPSWRVVAAPDKICATYSAAGSFPSSQVLEASKKATLPILALVALLGSAAPNARMPNSSRAMSAKLEHSNGLLGVWQPVETILVPDSTVYPGDRAGPSGPALWIFTERHYAVLGVHSAQPRQPFNRSTATAAELLAAWDNFGANAGTYHAADGVITMQLQVAKNPEAMAPGAKGTISYRLQGDTLWLWGLNGRRTSQRVRHVRVE